MLKWTKRHRTSSPDVHVFIPVFIDHETETNAAVTSLLPQLTADPRSLLHQRPTTQNPLPSLLTTDLQPLHFRLTTSPLSLVITDPQPISQLSNDSQPEAPRLISDYQPLPSRSIPANLRSLPPHLSTEPLSSSHDLQSLAQVMTEPRENTRTSNTELDRSQVITDPRDRARMSNIELSRSQHMVDPRDRTRISNMELPRSQVFIDLRNRARMSNTELLRSQVLIDPRDRPKMSNTERLRSQVLIDPRDRTRTSNVELSYQRVQHPPYGAPKGSISTVGERVLSLRPNDNQHLAFGSTHPALEDLSKHARSRSLPASPQKSQPSTQPPETHKKTSVLSKFKNFFKKGSNVKKEGMSVPNSPSSTKMSPAGTRRSRSPMRIFEGREERENTLPKTRLTRLIESKRDERRFNTGVQKSVDASQPLTAYKPGPTTQSEYHTYVQHSQIDRSLGPQDRNRVLTRFSDIAPPISTTGTFQQDRAATLPHDIHHMKMVADSPSARDTGTRIPPYCRTPGEEEESLLAFGESLLGMVESGSYHKVKVMPSLPDSIIQARDMLSPVHRRNPSESIPCNPVQTLSENTGNLRWSMALDGSMILTSDTSDEVNDKADTNLLTFKDVNLPKNNNNGHENTSHHVLREYSDIASKSDPNRLEFTQENADRLTFMMTEPGDRYQPAVESSSLCAPTLSGMPKAIPESESASDVRRLRVRDIVKSFEGQHDRTTGLNFREIENASAGPNDSPQSVGPLVSYTNIDESSEVSDENPTLPFWLKLKETEAITTEQNTSSLSAVQQSLPREGSGNESEGFSPKKLCSFEDTRLHSLNATTKKNQELDVDYRALSCKQDVNVRLQAESQESVCSGLTLDVPSVNTDLDNDTWMHSFEEPLSTNSNLDSLVSHIEQANGKLKDTLATANVESKAGVQQNSCTQDEFDFTFTEEIEANHNPGIDIMNEARGYVDFKSDNPQNCYGDETSSPSEISVVNSPLGDSLTKSDEQMLHIPQVEQMPHTPQVEQMTHVSKVEQTPHIPQVEQMRHTPQVEQMPHIPQVEQMSYFSQFEQKPHIPQVEKISHIPQVEHMPHIPKVEKTPHIPQVEQTPHIPQVEHNPHIPQVEKTPHIPQVEQMSHIPQVEQKPHIPQVEQTPNIPQTKQMPHIPQVEQTRYIPQVEQMPYIHIVEETPNIPQVEETRYISQVEQTPYIQQVEQMPYIPQVEQMPDNLQVEETPYIPQVEQSRYILQVEQTPYIPQVEQTPYIPQVEQMPHNLQVEETPYIPQVEQTPLIPLVEQTPYIPQVEQTPYISQVEQTPHIPLVEPTPYMPQVEQTPYIPQVEQMPHIPQVDQTHYIPQVEQMPHIQQLAVGCKDDTNDMSVLAMGTMVVPRLKQKTLTETTTETESLKGSSRITTLSASRNLEASTSTPKETHEESDEPSPAQDTHLARVTPETEPHVEDLTLVQAQAKFSTLATAGRRSPLGRETEKDELAVKPKKKVSFSLDIPDVDSVSSHSEVAVIETTPVLTPALSTQGQCPVEETADLGSDNASSTDVSYSFSLKSNEARTSTTPAHSVSVDDVSWWAADTVDELSFFHDHTWPYQSEKARSDSETSTNGDMAVTETAKMPARYEVGHSPKVEPDLLEKTDFITNVLTVRDAAAVVSNENKVEAWLQQGQTPAVIEGVNSRTSLSAGRINMADDHSPEGTFPATKQTQLESPPLMPRAEVEVTSHNEEDPKSRPANDNDFISDISLTHTRDHKSVTETDTRTLAAPNFLRRSPQNQSPWWMTSPRATSEDRSSQVEEENTAAGGFYLLPDLTPQGPLGVASFNFETPSSPPQSVPLLPHASVETSNRNKVKRKQKLPLKQLPRFQAETLSEDSDSDSSTFKDPPPWKPSTPPSILTSPPEFSDFSHWSCPSPSSPPELLPQQPSPPELVPQQPSQLTRQPEEPSPPPTRRQPGFLAKRRRYLYERMKRDRKLLRLAKKITGVSRRSLCERTQKAARLAIDKSPGPGLGRTASGSQVYAEASEDDGFVPENKFITTRGGLHNQHVTRKSMTRCGRVPDESNDRSGDCWPSSEDNLDPADSGSSLGKKAAPPTRDNSKLLCGLPAHGDPKLSTLEYYDEHDSARGTAGVRSNKAIGQTTRKQYGEVQVDVDTADDMIESVELPITSASPVYIQNTWKNNAQVKNSKIDNRLSIRRRACGQTLDIGHSRSRQYHDECQQELSRGQRCLPLNIGCPVPGLDGPRFSLPENAQNLRSFFLKPGCPSFDTSSIPNHARVFSLCNPKVRRVPQNKECMSASLILKPALDQISGGQTGHSSGMTLPPRKRASGQNRNSRSTRKIQSSSVGAECSSTGCQGPSESRTPGQTINSSSDGRGAGVIHLGFHDAEHPSRVLSGSSYDEALSNSKPGKHREPGIKGHRYLRSESDPAQLKLEETEVKPRALDFRPGQWAYIATFFLFQLFLHWLYAS